METNYGKSKVNLFLKRLERQYPRLVKEKKISSPNKDVFFTEYLGLGNKSWLNFYPKGIKKIYFVILELLEENEKLKEKNIKNTQPNSDNLKSH